LRESGSIPHAAQAHIPAGFLSPLFQNQFGCRLVHFFEGIQN
jgi:hypothetical protein